jgi:UDP-N-acetylmuramate dehydrogenase
MQLESDVPLAPLTTMYVGGPARWYVRARTEDDVCQAVRWARERDVPLYILGGGSNVVISDQGLGGLALHVDVRGRERRHAGGVVEYAVGAGEEWDSFVAATVAENLAGVECLSGIPGSVGGTPVQNVGAYGQDVSETIATVRAIDRRSGDAVTLAAADCAFAYRSSRFKTSDAGKFVVTRVNFRLAEAARPTVSYADVVRYFDAQPHLERSVQTVRDAVLQIRRGKGMVIESANPANRSCGSFFVNPVISTAQYAAIAARLGVEPPKYVVDENHVKVPAAWLIERAGFPKGTTRGTVGISPFQAQAIVNHGSARAADVVTLACDIKQAVAALADVLLVPEPVFLGFAPSAELTWLLTAQRSY